MVVAAPKKKRRSWPWVLGGIVLLLVILLVVALRHRRELRQGLRPRLHQAAHRRGARHRGPVDGEGRHRQRLGAVPGARRQARTRWMSRPSRSRSARCRRRHRARRGRAARREREDRQARRDVRGARGAGRIGARRQPQRSRPRLDHARGARDRRDHHVQPVLLRAAGRHGDRPSAEEGQIVFTPTTSRSATRTTRPTNCAARSATSPTRCCSSSRCASTRSLPVALTIVDVDVVEEGPGHQDQRRRRRMGGTDLSTPGTCAS